MADTGYLLDTPGIALTRRPGIAMINLRGPSDDPAFVARASAVIGLPLVTAPNRFVAANGRQCIWQGPDEWLVGDAHDPADGLCARLDEGLSGWHHAVTDVSGNRVTLCLAGSGAIAALGVGCPLDLDPRSFVSGMAAQTVLARTAITLMKIDDHPSFEILVRRSLVRYVTDWLVDASGRAC